MRQGQIKYSDVIELGFKVYKTNDSVFFDIHGYKWIIVNFDLTPQIYLDWDIETMKCQMIRSDDDKNIQARHNIKDLDELRHWIEFFTTKTI